MNVLLIKARLISVLWVKLCGFLCTCPVAQSEVGALVFDATDVPDGGEAGVVGVILRPQILQLQNLCLSLKHRRTSLDLFQLLQVCATRLTPAVSDQLRTPWGFLSDSLFTTILCLL